MMPSGPELRRDFIVPGLDAVVPADACRSWAPGCLKDFDDVVAVIGAFDGVHTGHRDLIARACADAKARGAHTAAVTFDPDPDTVVGRRPAHKLTIRDDRLALLAASGVDAVLVTPFTHELSQLDHVSFFEHILLAACNVVSIHVGTDFRLGRGGASTVDVMHPWCEAHGIALTGHELLRSDGEVVSSSHIRGHLAAGNLTRAEAELGRRYMVRGRVRSGRGEGTGMGFPTANIAYGPDIQIPAEGVYSGLALVRNTVWPAAINVGIPPTFADRAASASMEANLIGFSGSIYGEEISIVFARRLRGLVKFSSQEELVRTVLDNIDSVKQEFGEHGVGIHDL